MNRPHDAGENARGLRDRVALITGAAMGLGAALSEVFLAAGARVALVDVEAAKLQQLVTRLDPERGRTKSIVADVSQVEECRRAVEQTEKHFGRLDILVNNAGICPRVLIPDVTEEIFDRVLDINLKGAFFLSQAAAAVMQKRKEGKIINISSVGARTGGMMAASVYSASKAGLLALTKSFARELAPYGICVNAVAPGMMTTRLITELPPEKQQALAGQVPLGRIAEPEELARVVLFLAGDDAAYMTGSTVDVNGGWFMY